jgi:hypothetical protein
MLSRQILKFREGFRPGSMRMKIPTVKHLRQMPGIHRIGLHFSLMESGAFHAGTFFRFPTARLPECSTINRGRRQARFASGGNNEKYAR